MLLDQLGDFAAPLIDRQIGLKLRLGQCCLALEQGGAGLFKQRGKVRLQFFALFARRPQHVALHAAQAAVIRCQAEQAFT